MQLNQEIRKLIAEFDKLYGGVELKDKKSWCKRCWLLIAVILIIAAAFIPQILDWLYPKKGFWFTKTSFSKEALLSFYGTFLAFLGTVSLGALALWQNKKANEINMRILKLEETSNVPFLHIDASNSHINCISECEVDIVIGLRNESNGIINIAEVSDMKYDLFLLSQNDILPFCKEWTKHYSVLPDQVLPINFFSEVEKDQSPIIDRFDEIDKAKIFQMHCNFNVTMHFVNSKEKYKQQYELILNCFKKDNNRDFIMSIDSIENSIVIQEEK